MRNFWVGRQVSDRRSQRSRRGAAWRSGKGRNVEIVRRGKRRRSGEWWHRNEKILRKRCERECGRSAGHRMREMRWMDKVEERRADLHHRLWTSQIVL